MPKDYSKYSDEELIAKLREVDSDCERGSNRGGNPDIEDYIMNKYKSLVKQKARPLYIERGDKEDLIQEGMLGLFKAVREFDPGRDVSFSAFAGVCITNKMYSAVTAHQRKKHAILNDSCSLSDPDTMERASEASSMDPESVLIGVEAEKLLRERIKAALSPMENEVLEYYLSGMDYREIAEKMNRKEKSIDNAFQRIRRKVREIRKD